jgi:beta-lactamase superfamily II metal-dependent hydrolase
MTGQKSGARKARKTSQAGREVRVRMYNVGFGDSFLLWVPSDKRTLKVLVDCGSHAAGPGPQPIRAVAEQIVRDVTEGGRARIDLVVATHRHQDHVSGFESDVWEDVEVGEVWMPWTEHPTDPHARRIRETQSKIAAHLTAAIQRLALGTDLEQLVGNSLTNAKAMQTLHEGFAGNPKRRFLPDADRAKCSFEPDCLPGVSVHVMGPSRDDEVIRDMDPPVGQSYLRMRESEAMGATEDNYLPFRSMWANTIQNYEIENPNLKLSAKELQAVDGIGSGEELAVAVALDKAVNGTSLMIVFQVGKACLLFPGDAQWGTWQGALKDPEWRTLLNKTTFHKISHHASHNGSPKEFVDQVLGRDFWAMASTRAMARWKQIPKPQLLTALREKSSKVVRSDKPDPEDSDVFSRRLGRMNEPGGLWVDTAVPVR